MSVGIKQEDEVFIDTNILVYLFAPSVSSVRVDPSKYASILNELIENKNKLYINSLVVSEFINVCLRDDFNNLFNINKDKKFKRDYRKSEEYINTLNIILKQLKKILSLTTKIDDNFSEIDIFLEYEKNERVDFNDLIIAKNVIDNNFKLLTNDKDFKRYPNISIIKI